jgi:hypothetical protein
MAELSWELRVGVAGGGGVWWRVQLQMYHPYALVATTTLGVVYSFPQLARNRSAVYVAIKKAVLSRMPTGVRTPLKTVKSLKSKMLRFGLISDAYGYSWSMYVILFCLPGWLRLSDAAGHSSLLISATKSDQP